MRGVHAKVPPTALNEVVNEISAAREFLRSAECKALSYEPPLEGTQKTIDFLFLTTEGQSIFLDVKTVHPQETDGWPRYQRLQPHFSPGTHVLLDKNALGCEIAHDRFSALERFLEYTP